MAPPADSIEQYLIDYYGQSKDCWLTGGIEGDDTDGHIDDLARFISPTKIVFGVDLLRAAGPVGEGRIRAALPRRRTGGHSAADPSSNGRGSRPYFTSSA